jgi:predicted murein hydrolase (TIGR00659 family)
MSLHLHEAWTAVSASPVFGVTLTLAAYQLARRLWLRAGNHPAVNPVLIAIVLVALVLWVTDVDYDTYMTGGSVIALLLGPATVALAWPLHLEMALVRRAVLPILVGVTTGSGVAVVVAMSTTRVLGGSAELATSMAPKSATTPVAIALSETVGGIPSLTAVLTILTGILGAVIGPRVLSWMRVRDKTVRGLAVGVSSHGIGTAQMIQESRTEGAFSGLAMALGALATSVWVPVLVPLLS